MGGRGGGPRARNSNKFPDAASAGGEPQLANHCLRTLENSQKMDGKCPACVNLAAGWPQALQAGAELGFGGKVWGCGSSTWEGVSFGQPRKNIDGRGCLPPAGVHRSLQAPGTWSSPGEAGHRSCGHWEDHLGLLDKVTAGKIPREATLVRPQPQVCVGLGSEAAQRQRS